MSRFKRSKYLIFTIETLAPPDRKQQARPELVAAALISGHYSRIGTDEMGRLRAWPEDTWRAEEELEAEGWTPTRLRELARHGVLLRELDEEDPSIDEAEWQGVEHALEGQVWPPFGLIFQTMNQHAENFIAERAKDDVVEDHQRVAHRDADSFVHHRGQPPPVFHRPEPVAPPIDLPSFGEEPVDFFATLRRRRSLRTFRKEGALGLEKVSRLLYWSFGCLATRRLGSSFLSMFKAAPSGGALHPVETYVLALRAEGLPPGLYHYDAEHHRLTPRRLFPDTEAAREFAAASAQRQLFVADAALVVYLCPRFQRNFWKYRERNNTYAVILQDLGHLSQTCQLVGTALDLGTCYTGAIYPKLIAAALGFSGPEEAALGLLAIGEPTERDPMQEGIEPYDPFTARPSKFEPTE